jgi:hypothetical protein
MMHEGISLLLLLYVFFFTVISVAVNIFICYRVEPRSQEGTNDARRDFFTSSSLQSLAFSAYNLQLPGSGPLIKYTRINCPICSLLADIL